MGGRRDVGQLDDLPVAELGLRVVTLVIDGPPSTRVQVTAPRGPTFAYDGHRAVWSAVLSTAEQASVEATLRASGLQVTSHVVDPAEGVAERAALHTAPTDAGWVPTVACPSCAWLDLDSSEGFVCGVRAWPFDIVSAFDSGKAAADRRACPLQH